MLIVFYRFIFLGTGLTQNDMTTLFYLACCIIFFILAFFNLRLNKKKKSENEEEAKKSISNITRFKNLIETGQSLSWEEFFNLKFSTEVYTEVIECIKLGIEKGLFFGENFNHQNAYPFIRVIKEQTLLFFDSLALKSNLESYSFVEISRSTYEENSVGSYIYKFNDNDDLLLMKVPFRVKSFGSDVYPILDSNLITNVNIISKKTIKDFQVFGTQLMQTSISNTNINPGITTIFSELFFGSSYTILKGLSKLSFNSSHTIKDIRLVQVILNNKSDIEFSGISIFYDFNRRFGKIQNKENELTKNEKEFSKQKDIQINNSDYFEQLRKLKALLDEGILTQEEFDKKKKDLLNL